MFCTNIHSFLVLALTLVLSTACGAQSLTAAQACRMVTAKVPVDYAPRKDIFGATTLYVDLMILPCTNFESISAQGIANITVAISYKEINPARDSQQNNLRGTMRVQYFFIRTDQGWKIKSKRENP